MLGKTDITGGKDVVLLPPGKLSEWLLGAVLALLAGLIAWLLRRAVVQFLSYDPLRYGEHLW